MILFQRLTSIACLLLLMGSANATTFTFTDTPLKKILITEAGVTPIPGPGFDGIVAPTGPLTRTIDYTPLRTITSAILTVQLSDDTSTTQGVGFVDIPSEVVQMNSVTGTGTITPPPATQAADDVDGNSTTVPAITPTLYLDVATLPPPGTISDYFMIDVASILSLSGGSLSFELEALNFYDAIPILPGFPGGPYVEDAIYNGATLTIEGTEVPVPPSLLLLGTALFGFIGFFRNKTPVA